MGVEQFGGPPIDEIGEQSQPEPKVQEAMEAFVDEFSDNREDRGALDTLNIFLTSYAYANPELEEAENLEELLEQSRELDKELHEKFEEDPSTPLMIRQRLANRTAGTVASLLSKNFELAEREMKEHQEFVAESIEEGYFPETE